jgi:phosphoribosylamine--glycine ligase
MRQYQIPTAEYAYFTDVEKAIDYLANHTFPVVIKASGLASGKGVIIAEDFEKARQTAYELLSERQFGESGAEIIIEEYLTGEEVSFMAICDGDRVCPLASSKDHKARDDGGKGPNTGGMGAYSPAPVIDQNRYQRLLNEIIQPTLEGLKQSGTPYKGFLYAGVIITPDDKIKVLEFNCRLGDPEAQPVLMRLKSDLLTYLNDACHGRLKTQHLNWYKASALGVVLASQGYPGQYPKGEPITGLNQDDGIETKLFHSGTQKHNDQVLTSGGRVLTCTALGETLDKACYKAYALADHITWPHLYKRSDIGQI